jgi:Family of unknown function (DUF5522)
MPDDQSPESGEREELREGIDYYWEGPYIVFTEAYHLKRGECCNSGCRHCPYRNSHEDIT